MQDVQERAKANTITPRQAAKALGVSESSVKRWCDQGVLPTVRTAGGHRRLLLTDVLQYVRAQKLPLVDPTILGLPANVRPNERGLAQSLDPFSAALSAGQFELAQRIVFDHYVAGETLVGLFDQLFAPAFREIGRLWECQSIDVYQERRACEISRRILEELRFVAGKPAADAPLAIGGTPEGDRYQLATTMAEIVLQAAGWNAVSMGASLPMKSMAAAVSQLKPRFCWLSVSHLEDRDAFVAEYQRFYAVAKAAGVPVIVGGKVLDSELRKQVSFTSYGDTLQHLVEFAGSLWTPSSLASETGAAQP